MKYYSQILNIILWFMIFINLYSCNRVEPYYNRENIKGAWIAFAEDDKDFNINDRRIYVFSNNINLSICGVTDAGNGNYKWTTFKDKYYYIYSDELDVRIDKIYGMLGLKDTVNITQKFTFPIHEDSYVELKSQHYTIDNVLADPGYNRLKMNKLPPIYSKPDSLVGKWEFESEALKDLIVEFQAENKLKFYAKEDGEWRLITKDEDRYDLYSEFIAFTIFDNKYLGQEGKWAVKCFDAMSASPYYGKLSMSHEGVEYYLRKVTEIN